MRDARDDADLAKLLLRVASCPRRAEALYQLLGDFCHEFRNRLNCLKLGLYLAKRERPVAEEGGWPGPERAYLELEQLIEQLQMICRPIRLVPIRLDLATFLEDRQPTWERYLANRELRLVLVSPGCPTVCQFDPTRLAKGLDTLVSWRAVVGAPGSVAQLRWGLEGKQIRLRWEEVPGRAREALPLDGVSPFSLAIPLLARIVCVHGGTIKFSNRSGLRLTLRWPVEHVSS
jgi:hypothetical protein